MKKSTLLKQGVVWLTMKFGASRPSITQLAYRWNSVCTDQLFTQTPTGRFPSATVPETVRPTKRHIMRFSSTVTMFVNLCGQCQRNNKYLRESSDPAPERHDLLFGLWSLFNRFSVNSVDRTLSIIYDWIVLTNCFADIFCTLYYRYEKKSVVPCFIKASDTIILPRIVCRTISL